MSQIASAPVVDCGIVNSPAGDSTDWTGRNKPQPRAPNRECPQASRKDEMDSTANVVKVTSEEVLKMVWASGYHSLCTQSEGEGFGFRGVYKTPEEMLAALAEIDPKNEQDAWFGVHGMDAKPDRRGGAADITAVAAFSADFDWDDPEAHKNVAVQKHSESEVRAIVDQIKPEPSLVINSGHGLHVYWALSEELDGEAGYELSSGFYRYIEDEYNLHNDRKEMASILRIPGTRNWKVEADPATVCAERFEEGVAINVSEIKTKYWKDLPPAPVLKKRLGLPGDDDEHPMEWLNKNGWAEFRDDLIAEGWTPLRMHGEEEPFVRPGKDYRDGLSAVFHHDKGQLNVFTQGTLPPIWYQLGKPFPGGWSVTPSDHFMIKRGITDNAEATRRIRSEKMSPTSPASAAPVDEPLEPPTSGMSLPEEFWNARPMFQHIRDAGYGSMTVPEALLGSVLGRYSAMVPPAVKLPAIIGAKATLDYITCVVAESSGGKTISNGAAAEILSGKTLSKRVDFDAPIGSGEGVIQAFMGYELNDKGKKMGDPSYKFGEYRGIHFTADEGTAITEAQKRSGTTLVQTLCSAWSGSTLGQLNASMETKRRIPGGKRRVAATINIQTALASELFESALIGLPKRMVFFWAHSEFPEQLPEHPGNLVVGLQNNVWDRDGDEFMEVCSEIREELRAHRRVVAAGTERLDDLDGHRGLLKLKTAALLALMDWRMDVNLEDWGLAEMIMTHSDKVRSHVLAVKRQADSRAADARTMFLAEREATVDDVKERKAVARLRDSIVRKVGEGPIATGKLSRATTSSGTRHRFSDAVAAAVADGAIEFSEADDKYTIA